MPPRSENKDSPAARESRSQTNTPRYLARDHPSLVHLADDIKKQWQWASELRTHQSMGIIAQLVGEDALIHAGTGSGKTAIAAGPHAHPSSKGKVTIMVSPLITLQEEQVDTFKDEYGLEACAVNSSVQGGIPRETMSASRLFLIVVDEAHLVSHWGADFRKKYGELGIIRALLPPGVPIVAMSATLPARVRKDVLAKLQFGKNFVNVNIGNDRPNISITDVKDVKDILKTFLYADNVIKGIDIEDHLRELLPPELHLSGAIRTYSAAFSKEYRKEVMRLFKLGVIRVLICTDAAGMGCNLPDIDLVVQWKLPGSVSAFVQRAGRATRDPTRVGLAVLLVEKSVYEIDIVAQLSVSQEKSTSKKGKKGTGKTKKAKAGKDYAEAHGASRGSYNGKQDAILTKIEPPLDMNSIDEGLYVLVQTGICRWKVLTKIYGNMETVPPTAPCCDLCDPSLLDRIRPSSPLQIPRQSSVKKGVPQKSTQDKLHEWQSMVYKRDFRRSLFGPSGIMKDETISLLSSVGPIHSQKVLEKVLAGQWTWYERYGDELLAWLMTLNMPPMVLKPKKPRGIKQAPQAAVDMPAAVRARTTAAAIPVPSGSGSQVPQTASQSAPRPGPYPTNYTPQPVAMNYWPISQPQPQFQFAPQQSQSPNPSHFSAPMHFRAPMRISPPTGTLHFNPYQHLAPQPPPGSPFTFSMPFQPANPSDSGANPAPSFNPYRHLALWNPQPPLQ
ncbi:P-loop containing nucleoside triphosphate hydrolase protein [Mycena floridula]|nr:P-loop containing nucleoside triphosphate hydrolase protein [Mycena floridula]